MSEILNRYRITSPFGWRDSPFDSQKKEFHTGIDLADGNHELLCFISGLCRRSRIGNFGEGNYIQIVSEIAGVNYYTNYFHCEETWVNEGNAIQRYDSIGIMGNTGYSTGTHLHFEVFTMSPNINDTVRYFMRNGRYKIIGKRMFFDPKRFLYAYELRENL